MSEELESPNQNRKGSLSRLYFPSSPKKKRLLSNSSLDDFTEIRGRKYLLSPQSSSPKHKPSRRQLGTSENVKRSFSFSAPEQDAANNDKEISVPKKSINPMRRKPSKRGAEVDIISSYGSEREQKIPPQKHPKSVRHKTAGSQQSVKQEKNKPATFSKEIVFSSSVAQKWQPISSEVLSVFNNILVAALGQSTGGLRGANKVQAEKQLQGVMREVNHKLKSARAPRHKRLGLTDRAKQKMIELKEECVELVQRNGELEEGLEEKTRVTAELNSQVEQLGSANATTVVRSRTDHQAAEALKEMNNFEEYISHLLTS